MHDFPPQVPSRHQPPDHLPSGLRGTCPPPARARLLPTRTPAVRRASCGWLLWQQLPVLSSELADQRWWSGCPARSARTWWARSSTRASSPHDLDDRRPAQPGHAWDWSWSGSPPACSNHTMVVRTWLVGMYGPMKMVTRKATQLGHVLPQRTPTGEVLSVAAGDTDEFGALTEIVSRGLRRLDRLPGHRRPGALDLAPARAGGAGRRAAGRAARHAAAQARCSAGRRSSAPGPPTSPRWPPTSWPGCGSCAASAASRPSPATTPRSRSTPGRPGSRPASGRRRSTRTGVLLSGLFLVVLTWLGRSRGGRRRADRRPADQLLRVRGVHGLADPDLLRARAEVGALPGLGAQGHRRARTAAAVARRLSSRCRCPLGDPLHDQLIRIHRAAGRVHRSWCRRWPTTRPRWPTGSAATCPATSSRSGSTSVDGLKGRAARRARKRREAERLRLAERDSSSPAGTGASRLGSVDLADVPVGRGASERIVVSDASSQVFAGTLQAAIDPHGRLSLEPGRGGAARCGGRGRLRRHARRLAGQDRRARPRPVRRPAAAGGAGPRAGARPARS